MLIPAPTSQFDPIRELHRSWSQNLRCPSFTQLLKMFCWNPLGEFRVFWAGTTCSPCMALQKSFLCFRVQCFSLFGTTCASGTWTCTWWHVDPQATCRNTQKQTRKPASALSSTRIPQYCVDPFTLALYDSFPTLLFPTPAQVSAPSLCLSNGAVPAGLSTATSQTLSLWPLFEHPPIFLIPDFGKIYHHWGQHWFHY